MRNVTLDIGGETSTSSPSGPGCGECPFLRQGRREGANVRFPRLPLGISDFATIREGGCCYADRTGGIASFLIHAVGSFALSRPPFFGKTLTLSTMDAMLSGRRELFEGLAGEAFVAGSPFLPMPVLRYDFGEMALPPVISTEDVIAAMEDGVLARAERNAEAHGGGISRQDGGAALVRRDAERQKPYWHLMSQFCAMRMRRSLCQKCRPC
jgi:hypothetical protein